MMPPTPYSAANDRDPETAIEAEAVAQALCMETEDFARAFGDALKAH